MGGVCSGYTVPKKILLTGPKGSGKTTLLYTWCVGGKDAKVPRTESFNVEMVHGPRGGQLLLVWDVTDPIRRRQFFHGTEAIVYMIDSRYLSDLDDVRDDLHVLLEDRDLKHLPVLLVLGKKDLTDMFSLDELGKKLGLLEAMQSRQYDWVSVRKDDNRTYQTALYKLCELIFS
ncbi:ADP-ribosylation factor-like [Dreissena polymorpha]|uniref:Uncharacterized protein n=1 Tax=Dreissena polymorpha TaxID=45954 RepID=A0A9D4QZA8_DREPO|nr:ADP-ribosylation factor-like [Dreissena polymorpha]KAH3848342.1 hypothetical protein DPMN_090702 [Dreissena polymorpha]